METPQMFDKIDMCYSIENFNPNSSGKENNCENANQIKYQNPTHSTKSIAKNRYGVSSIEWYIYFKSFYISS